MKNQLIEIVLQPYHQIQAEFVTILNKDQIIWFLSLYSKNPKVKKSVLCLWEQQIQPIFGDEAIKQM